MHHGLVMLHGLGKGSGSLPGQADNGIAVGAVVGDFKVYHGIVVADDFIDVVTGLTGVRLQNPDAVGKDAGQVILGQTQLREGAEHTAGHLAS